MVLLDAARAIRYQGRIDDQFGRGTRRTGPTRRDLAEAVAAVLDGKDVAVPATEAIGCPIARPAQPKESADVTYSKHVAPILMKHCQECHRPGEIGPFSLMTFAQAAAWSEAIVEETKAGRMPPWHADPAVGSFHEPRTMADADKKTLAAWAAAGCPEGDAKDAPPAREFVTGWSIGKPDEVFKLKKPNKIPAKGPTKGMQYQYHFVGEPFTEDRWVKAAQARPSNRGVVHHIIAWAVPPDAKGNPVEGYAVEALLKSFKKTDGDGLAKPDRRLRAGGFAGGAGGRHGQAHPEGEPVRVRDALHAKRQGVRGPSYIGVVYAKETPKVEVKTRAITNYSFKIPPGDADHKVESTTTFDRDVTFLGMFPHMHLRGKSFAYTLTEPDGKPEKILSVPRYDFNWQETYRLTEPRKLRKGTRIDCVATFDNSAENPNNPDPKRTVGWGNQTWDEMMIGFVDYAVPVDGK